MITRGKISGTVRYARSLLQAPCMASEKVIVIDDKFVASRVF